jgi:hypothetical protein
MSRYFNQSKFHGKGLAQYLNWNPKSNFKNTFGNSLFSSTNPLIISKQLYLKADSLNEELLEFFYGPKCKLEETFQSWYSLTQLHLWMFVTKARLESRNGKKIAKELVNHLTSDLEIKLYDAGLKNPVAYERTLKELISAHTGCTIAYDEGFSQGDHVLANALWRNVFVM